ncbi:MAG TPA: CBASS cGAMP-activated phospholipase [Acidimicrobiales bacterium]
MSSRRFQILALDGGGYKGMFAAAVLACLEEDLRTSIVEHFDLVAGTSTGGIIALALGAGKTPREIVDFYVEHGPRIFSHRRRRMVRQLVRSKYNVQPLQEALQGVLGDRCLWESSVPLCVPSYDLENDDVYLFRTPHSERLARDWRERMVDVALATSAAPTYLSAHHLRGLRLVDGGLWANNPAVVAIAEAVSEFKVDLADIRVLSLGTTRDLGVRSDRLDRGGLAAWATCATAVILRGQSLAAKNATFHLIPKGQSLRIDPDVPEKLLQLDGVSPDRLMGRAEQESRFVNDQVRQIFLDHHAGPYNPLHTPDRSPTQ